MCSLRFFHLIIIIFFSVNLYSQETHIRFRRITINDGLSLSSVYCVFQDSKGFMWFGTEDGLNKYDGKNFTIYRVDRQNPNSISHRWIEHILEDNLGILWFGSRGGLTRYNPRTDNFSQFINIDSDTLSLSNDTITAMVMDRYNNLWVGTRNGLNRINYKTSRLERILLDRSIGSRDVVIVNALLPDKEGNLWIGTNHGLFIYKERSGECDRIIHSNMGYDFNVLSLAVEEDILWIGSISGLVRYSIKDNESAQFNIFNKSRSRFPDQSIERLHIDRHGVIWVATRYGLFDFDYSTQQFQLVVESLDLTHSLAINTAKPLYEDSNGFIWYGTFGGGVYKISTIKRHVHNFKNNPADVHSLSENSINCIYEDRSGGLWFGTFGAGISIYDPKFHKFVLLRHNPLDNNSLSSNFVWSVFEARDGSVWIGTNDKGLNRYSPQTETFTFYDQKVSDPNSLSNSSVREIYEDSRGTLWIGTDGGGLSKFYSGTESFQHYRYIPDDPTTLSDNSVRVIHEDKEGFLWIGTRRGLNRFDPKTQKNRRYLSEESNPQTISNNFIYSIASGDNKGVLWLGTYGGGLNMMDMNNETFISYQYDPENQESLSDDDVLSIYNQGEGIIWVGTNGGLNRFDASKGKFRRFGIKDGLPSDVIYGILPDDQNNIWLSTNYGVSCLSLLDFSVKNYDVNDGLQSNEFNGGAFHGGSSGKIYFGGVYGLNVIDPKNISVYDNVGKVVFTKLEILGNEVLVKPPSLKENRNTRINTIREVDGNFYMGENISYANEILLGYRHRSFSLEFSELNNLIPEKVNYSYRMAPLDKQWHYAGKRNYVSYANIDPGDYVFNVKVESIDGRGRGESGAIKISIKPPYWRTWWFLILELLFTLGVAIFFYRYLLKVRTNRLLRFQNQQIREANQKLVESERSLKELNATKDKFFSIISHDLKNPFTSLLSISESMQENFQTIDEKEKLVGMHRIHGAVKYIYDLLENLLTWSQSQTGRIRHEPVNFDISQVIEDNINLHKIAAEKKGISIINRVENNKIAYADREMINTVVRNLLHNALKFTDSGGNVELAIKDGKDFFTVIVSDQGVGISPENLSKLFWIDKKLKSKGTQGERGTGLGLILCKEFVELNGGQINVRSTLNIGSEFSFSIPTKRE